jgi:hypothetical protein
MRFARIFVLLMVFAAPVSGNAAIYTVSNTNNSGAGSLRQAILDANATGAYSGIVSGSNIINVAATGTISLDDALPMIFSNLTINGNGITIDGGGAHRCFFVSGLPTTPYGTPQAIAVNLNNLQLSNCTAKGGDGGAGAVAGGGGLGAGGAVFVNSGAHVSLFGISFAAAGATGGNGGLPSSTSNGFAGGGGLGGAGGDSNGVEFGSGGGIGGAGRSNGGGGGIGGASGTGNGGGGGGFGGAGIGQISAAQGFGAAGAGYQGIAGGTNGGGGGGGGIGGTSGQSGSGTGIGGVGSSGGGGGGGFGASDGTSNDGGSGGIGGGGGGGDCCSTYGSGGFGGGGSGGGGNGGFGGGGGAHGSGGFGGGGGGSGNGAFGGGGGAYGSGGFGGGSGSFSSIPGGGGGGGAMGGAIFVVDGGSLAFGGSGTLAGGTLVAGAAGDSNAAGGSAFGTGIFLQGNGTLTFDETNSAIYTISDAIADQDGSAGPAGNWGLQVAGDGTGTVILSGGNTYYGATEVQAGGVLEVDGQTISTATVDASGALLGIGTVANVLNHGILAPGNANTSLIDGTPPLNHELSVGNFSQAADGELYIGADNTGDSTLLVVSGSAGLDGLLHLHFPPAPLVGTTYTVLTAGSINGQFAAYSTNPKSVFGELTHTAHAVLFTVLGNDLIFRDGFDGGAVTNTGACITKQQFADIPGTVLQNYPVCVPPFGVTDPNTGTTVLACQTSMCTPTVAGCTTTLRTTPGTLTGTLAASYLVATPMSADTMSGPLHISGLAGTVDCTGTLSGISAELDTTYLASLDYLGDAFVYELPSVQIQGLTGTLTASGCGLYGTVIPFAQPYVIQQMQVQINNIISSYLPSGGIEQAPGVGDTICPAP